ncbi:MAG: hypothetical protein JO260_01900, partial [Acidobacteria bacterium]|nr:hypothetical protein [Acidobacteriota bacterium]
MIRALSLLAIALVLLPATVFTIVSAQDRLTLVATGSSLPEPLCVAWADEFRKQNPLIVIRYLPQGTGESAQDILSGSGDPGG